MWASVVERGLSGHGSLKRRHAKVQKSSNYLDAAVATGAAQRTSSGSYTVTGYMRQQETNDLEPPAPARRVKRCNIRASVRSTVPPSTIGAAGEEPSHHKTMSLFGCSNKWRFSKINVPEVNVCVRIREKKPHYVFLTRRSSDVQRTIAHTYTLFRNIRAAV